MPKSWWKRNAAERVFSILSNSYDRQKHSLKDYSKPLSCYSTIVGSVCTCITGVFLCFYGND